MAQFVIGELAVLQNASYFEEWDGALAVVVGGLKLRNPRDMHTMQRQLIMSYRVQPLAEGAKEVHCKPHQLRKLSASDKKTQEFTYDAQIRKVIS